RYVSTSPVNADQPRDAQVSLYCTTPAGEFFHGVSIRNSSSVPVTLLGLAPEANGGAGTLSDDPTLFRLLGLRLYRVGGAGDADVADPRLAPELTPIEIAPGDRLELWVQMGTGAPNRHE